MKKKKSSSSSPVRHAIARVKRNVYDLGVKQKIIQWHSDNGLSQGDTARHFNIEVSCLSRWLCKASTISKIHASSGGSVKRIRQAQHPELERCLFHWILEAHAHNLAISGSVLQEKAMRFAGLLGHKMKCSKGWLDNFKKRYNIYNVNLAGEAASVSSEDADHARANLLEITKNYELRDIYNADDTGLLFRSGIFFIFSH